MRRRVLLFLPILLAAATLRVGLASPQVAQDPMAIYTAEVDLKTGAVLRAPVRLETPLKSSWLPQYSKDGRRLAFLSSDAVVDARDQRGPAQQVVTRPQPVLSIRALDTGETTSFPLKLNQVFAFDWSPDGRTFVLQESDPKGGRGLHLVDAATGDVTQLAIGTPDVVRYLVPQWAGEGRRLYYIKGRPGVVSDINPLLQRDLDSGEERVFFNWSDVRAFDGAAFGIRDQSVSPDGRKIAGWNGAGFTNGTLWVVPLDTKSPKELFRVDGNPYSIAGRGLVWTADSRAVVINRPEGREVNTRRSLWVVPIDGSAPVKLAIDLPIQNLAPSIHPDGRRIAFVSGIAQTGAQAGQPTYEKGTGPVIAFDEAHQNPPSPATPALFELLRADGYRPRPLTQRLSAASLADVGVLVINCPGGLAALDAVRAHVGKPPSTGSDEEATQAQAASLSDDEVSAVVAWLKAGGSVLLVVDHAPYPLAAAKLTAALGIQNWPNGSAGIGDDLCSQQPNGCGAISFWRSDFYPGGEPTLAAVDAKGTAYQSADAVLAKHPISEGRNADERIRRVVVFGGSAFQAPPGAAALLTLPRSAGLGRRMSGRTPIPGWLQGAVMEVGKGRLAVFADNAVVSGGTAGDNRQFVLNVMHWLSRAL